MELKQIFRLIIAAHWALIVLAFAVFALSENLDKEYEEVLLDINQRDIISMIVVVCLTKSFFKHFENHK